MHKSMEILMARMDSHPQEFDVTFRHMGIASKLRWDFVLKPLMERCEAIIKKEPCFLLGFLSDDEVSEVFAKLMQVQGDACTRKIMNELLHDEGPAVRFGEGVVGTGVAYATRCDDSSPRSGSQRESGGAWIY